MSLCVNYNALTKIMAFSNFKVIWVMRWCYLYTTCTIFHINIGIFYYWQFPTDNWKYYIFAYLILKSRIFWVYSNGKVTKHSFWTSSCYCDVILAIFKEVFDVPKIPFFFFVVNFCIRYSCFSLYIPVYYPISLID